MPGTGPRFGSSQAEAGFKSLAISASFTLDDRAGKPVVQFVPVSSARRQIASSRCGLITPS